MSCKELWVQVQTQGTDQNQIDMFLKEPYCPGNQQLRKKNKL